MRPFFCTMLVAHTCEFCDPKLRQHHVVSLSFCVRSVLSRTCFVDTLAEKKTPTRFRPPPAGNMSQSVLRLQPRLRCSRAADVPTLFQIVDDWLVVRRSRDIDGLLQDP